VAPVRSRGMKVRKTRTPLCRSGYLHPAISRKRIHKALIHHLRQAIILGRLHWWFVLTRVIKRLREKTKHFGDEPPHRLVNGVRRDSSMPANTYISIPHWFLKNWMRPGGISREWYIYRPQIRFSTSLIMYFNRTLLFSIVLCVAGAFASSDPLEARTLEERSSKCIGRDAPCVLSRQCCDGLSCSNMANRADSRIKEKFQYVVSDVSVS